MELLKEARHFATAQVPGRVYRETAELLRSVEKVALKKYGKPVREVSVPLYFAGKRLQYSTAAADILTYTVPAVPILLETLKEQPEITGSTLLSTGAIGIICMGARYLCSRLTNRIREGVETSQLENISS